MKILLIYPQWTAEYGVFKSFAKAMSSFPPLHLAYLAAIAEKQGHEVKIIDGEVNGISNDNMVNHVAAFDPDIIALSATSPFFHVAVDLATKIKAICSVPICIGGAHITVMKEKAFPNCFDYGFIGEADNSWAEFLSGKDVRSIKGMIYRDSQLSWAPIVNDNAEPVMDLDSIPTPARHLLDNEKYITGTIHGNKPFATIMSMRGCPFKCAFCSTKVFGNVIRYRSPRMVVDEIKSVVQDYGIRHFLFCDDTLTLNKKHISEICNLLSNENVGITFEGSTRANLVEDDLIALMSRAGLIRLSFGLESVDETIRKNIRKEVPLESYTIANRIANKYGIEVANSCIIGLPGETHETVKKTLSFLRDSPEILQANISIAVPYPGTELYEMAKRGDHRLKLMTEDFSQYKRYNSAVMTVGDLTPKELIDLQNVGFASIYFVPWRIIPMIKRSGLAGFMLTFNRLVKSILQGRFDMLFVNKDYWRK